ncbi:MAG TPA: hypothetical protein VGD65_12600 [Chryseosolibacter sp.]
MTIRAGRRQPTDEMHKTGMNCSYQERTAEDDSRQSGLRKESGE